MSFKDDTMKEVDKMKKEVKELKENSWFLDISHTMKKNQNRFFVMWLITFIAFIFLVGYVIYLHNDVGTETTITESYDIQQETEENGNNNFINGNDNEVNNGKAKD